jgi:hypothetical protein
MASREPNTVSSGALMARSQAVIGFWLMHCLGRPGMVAEPMQELFGLVASGELRVVEGEVYGLSESAPRPRGHAGAQDEREARAGPGSVSPANINCGWVGK